ncbi:PPK2 family polyphosphate kinase [Tessaracoccus sp. Y1736]
MTDFWSEDPRSALRVGPDFDLSTFDRAGTPGWTGDKDQAEETMKERGELLSELQERLFAHGRAGGNRKVLVVVQGLDTAGKGGITRHVMGMVDPQGVALRSFGVPTPEERRHHYLWRIKRGLPRPGLIGVFDRSHYEDVLVVRVEELVEEEVWRKRYAEINKWEKSLVDDETIVIKLALMVSHDEQGKRLMERLDRPDKRWKFSSGDLTTRARWDDFQEAYADVFRLTSTDHAPWYVLPADRKWYSRLAATEILTRALVDMDLKWPQPRWKPEVQRRQLAATMSPAALAESMADTEAVVMKALESSTEVREEAVMLRAKGQGDDAHAAALEGLRVKREGLLADLERTLAHKRELLAAVAPDLLPAPDDDAAEEEKKGKKNKKKGGKGKKK